MSQHRFFAPVSAATVAAIALVALLAVAASAIPPRERDAQRQAAVVAARDDALAAATSGVATVLSYDYRHLQQDFTRAESLLTPGPKGFRQQYIKTTAKGVEPLAAKYHAVSTAAVTAAGVVDNTADQAVVLVFVSQAVTNSQIAAPRLDRSRINVSLVKISGRWLIAGLAPI